MIVGESGGVEGFEAFRWTAETGMVGLGDLPGGSFDSHAFAVSGDGRLVVGRGSPVLGSPAFVWDAAHGMRSLDQVLAGLGVNVDRWGLGVATGISADGTRIVGLGQDPTGAPVAWMATIPEPGTTSLMIAALVSLAVYARR